MKSFTVIPTKENQLLQVLATGEIIAETISEGKINLQSVTGVWMSDGLDIKEVEDSGYCTEVANKILFTEKIY